MQTERRMVAGSLEQPNRRGTMKKEKRAPFTMQDMVKEGAEEGKEILSGRSR